ncbi:myosin-6 isoform X1 [Sorghum bicolor]|uniref:myosin-6 isoform X1 n=1 Tax=Sorghum bicolor TaxID=4558 RepID=UPI000B4243F4|nr:myosin-6 isoform X1 [Sorghum bicolor]|eukprot:XP_021307574.1 myosin-6 isoform X1 [Sorghum bicolor]
MASKSRFVVGSHVWVEDPDEAWMDGLVEQINGDELVVNCTSGKKVTVNVSSAYPKDTESPRGGVEDMTRLAYLHEPGVLQNLKSRFMLNEIYTYTGNILIAVNPFQRLPHLYNNDMMGIYKGAEFGELSPHPFAIADRSYRLMINDRISQAILVSGESGAGKTESTKSLMQYLAYMGGKPQAEGRSVQQQILESNPVLEAFGNAKTVRNNNSSRFGKFVEIQFDANGKISGAAIRTYLLERSRVCQISDPERNYHCFYMLCCAPSEDCKKYKLGDPRSFHYLNQSNCIALTGLDDAKEYMETRRAMGIVGMSSDEQDAIFRVVAAILHLGNVEFSEGSEDDSSKPKDEKSQFHLKTAAELFMCDEKGLEESLCKRVMATRGESITKNLDPRAAALSRDALARIVYSRLFDWIVNKINSSIGQDPDSKILIGVLDIYGFESFLTNSFEQFCINLTNEKLQQHFNQHVFKMEQEEYTKEEIDWSYIQFVDNQEILDLIEKKPGGIIALLDETCMLRNSTHETFAEKLYQKFKDNPHFSKPKFSRSDFTVHHYAGNVTYQTDLFLDKNIDYAVNEHQVLLNASKCSFVSSLFPPCEESTKSSKFTSIGSSFKQQLQSLLETLSATEPHYIRCIKPNNVLKPVIFENSNVLQQLRCGGVLEAIRISCLGYPTRRTFYEFVTRFGILQPKVLGRSHDEVTAAKMLLDKANLAGYQIGKTKVFLRAGQMAELDALRTEVLGLSAKKIQSKLRSFLARKKYIELQQCAIQIQAICRGTIARRCYENLRREAASLKMQTYYRMHYARKNYVEICSAATNIQSGLRGMGARIKLRLKRQTKAAVIIQSRCRCYLLRSQYVRLVKATITAQCGWRRRVARRELRNLKMAAKETGALQAAKSKLEKEVEELTWRLQLEKRIRADLEEAKTQENKKLQLQLQELQLQLKDTKDLLKREHEAAKEASEKAAAVPEILADVAQVNELTAENEKLKSLVASFEEKLQNAEQKFEETEKAREELVKKATDAEAMINELKNTMQSLQEKLTSTEAENHVLRQQSMKARPDNMPLLNMHRKSNLANGSLHSDEQTPHGTPMEFGRRSIIERHNESVDTLINCVVENVGFSEGKPVAAITIYKCLLHWRIFETDRTNVFDRLIQIFGSAMQKQDSNADLAYWLSNSSSLLIILQKSLKPPGSSVTTPMKRPQTQTSFLGRMGFRASSITVDMDLVRQVEAKYPALLFKQQLTAFVEGLYGMIRDNVKKEISSVISLVIQVTPSIESDPQAPRNAKAGLITDQGSYWQTIVNHLNDLLEILQENCVPTIFARKIFTQIFSFINAQLLNSLLVRRECCSFSNGEYVKQGLDELETWCTVAKPEYAGSAFDELKHICQAVGFLVIFKKFRISYDEIISDLCPVLSVQQIYKICTQYWDDKYNTESVSEEVLDEMKKVVNEGTGQGTSSDNTFLLNEEISMPLSLEEIANSMDAKEFQNVSPPQELLDNAAFQFLRS